MWCLAKKQRLDRKKGFTLIEVMVALSLFTMVIVAAVAVLLTMVDANRKAQNIQSVMTNLSFALDSMTRDIRTGTSYYCHPNPNQLPASGLATRDCNATEAAVGFSFVEGGSSITGIPGNCPNGSKRISYRLNNNTIERRLCNGDGVGGINQVSDWQPITSPEVVVNSLTFVTSGSASTDTLTPSVTVYIDGITMAGTPSQTDFQMQTTVSQQLLDI